MQTKVFETTLGQEKLTATFSDLADQTNGSVTVRLGDTVVLVTAVMDNTERSGQSWFPLTVDYEERFYAAGQILGSRYMRREGRPSDEAILTGRMIDRTIRPLFDQSLRRDIQIVATVLSLDAKNDPSVPAILGASLALATSDIPWAGPVSAIRLGLSGDTLSDFIINPQNDLSDDLKLDTIVCGTEDKINMIEAEAGEIKEDIIGQSFDLALQEINKLQTWQKMIIAEIGKNKQILPSNEIPETIINLFTDKLQPNLIGYIFSNQPGKEGINTAYKVWTEILINEAPDHLALGLDYLEKKIDQAIHDEGVNNQKRVDGRGDSELRPIFCQTGGLTDILHGSGIFFRGGTHILSILTLAGPKSSQLIEGMEIQGKKHFMHHYNFPPFSVGETGRLGGINRRAVGHGALAEKSLKAVLPDRETFPYTIRLVSEAMASNGSTSMGSVCGSTLALMDGGVPIKRPVAGIAVGLLYESSDKYLILTDIQGPEDHYGDMDFKVAGTTEGVTGIQLDIKVDGISVKILKEALLKAKDARLQIIDKITQTISVPNPDLKPSAPRIEMIKIPIAKIGQVIGPGGKVIQKISAETGAEIEIEDDGSIFISGLREGVKSAKETIEGITHEYQAGEKFQGTVTRIMDFGAFVKIGLNTEGLVHVSEIAPIRIDKVTDYLQEGDIVPVVIKEIDNQNRINLSIKQVDPDFIKNKKTDRPL